MNYPKMDEVETADITQLCRWIRFLPSPGRSAVGKDNFNKVFEKETKILQRVIERQADLGGMTPEISKKIGHG